MMSKARWPGSRRHWTVFFSAFLPGMCVLLVLATASEGELRKLRDKRCARAGDLLTTDHGIPATAHVSAGSHGGASGSRRKHSPEAVVVPEEENHERPARPRGLHAHVAPLIRRQTAKTHEPDRHSRRGRTPFVDQHTQGHYTGIHDSLQLDSVAQSRARYRLAPVLAEPIDRRFQANWALRYL